MLPYTQSEAGVETLPTLMCALTLALAANPASAGQINARWNACWGDGGIQNRVFACDTNTGSEQLVVSFISTGPVTAVANLQTVLGLAFAGTTTPPRWQFRATGT